jgi:hypothetical protein
MSVSCKYADQDEGEELAEDELEPRHGGDLELLEGAALALPDDGAMAVNWMSVKVRMIAMRPGMMNVAVLRSGLYQGRTRRSTGSEVSASRRFPARVWTESWRRNAGRRSPSPASRSSCRRRSR